MPAMERPGRILLYLLAAFLYRPCFVGAAPDTNAEGPLDLEAEEVETEDERVPYDAMGEAEEKGIIPPGAEIAFSSGPVTPLAAQVSATNYASALAVLARAEALWKKGEMEAASDVALEAYDDLMEIPLPRIRKKSKNKAALQKKRDQLRADRRRAATVYIHSSIDYVKCYVKAKGDTPEARKDGRARLEDLGDVAINYSDLNRMLYKAMEEMR